MRYILLLLTIHLVAFATEASVVEREGWYYDDANTSKSGMPTNLKYFKYYDMLSDEIVLEIFNKKNLSNLENRRIFVGYGTVDPMGTDCRVFPAGTNGLDNDLTVCLPWWRIEREYQLSASTTSDLSNYLCTLRSPRPPIMTNVCKQWEPVGKYNYPGGKVTCTSYYNRLLSADCWEDPIQSACYVNNCSDYVTEHCESVANVSGEVNKLTTAKYTTTEDFENGIISGDDTGNLRRPVSVQSKVQVITYQYNCPAGAIVPNQKCVDETSVLMFPYECTPDNPNTLVDDGEYVYCDKDKAQYSSSGDVVGFLGKCGDGRTVMCESNSLVETQLECLAPTYSQRVDKTISEKVYNRDYIDVEVDVLSGEPDIYSADPNCVRLNTVEDARDREIYVHIKGNGSLDDDIHVLRHLNDGTHAKVYCNMQHNEGKNSIKFYNNDDLHCIDNNGAYSFNQKVKINASDIVTVQQASENENRNGTPFALGRQHYHSTKVVIDDILVAPSAFRTSYPYYPGSGKTLSTWDNTLATFSILFPYSGAYRIQFFNDAGDIVADTTIGLEDFEQISQDGYFQPMLGKNMSLASGMTTEKACMDDEWVEWGGGVYGGKRSKEGTSCAKPNDTYVKNNAVYKLLVKDLLTGSITPIPLVYPIPYPNRIFISKLNVYETRKYRKYEAFPVSQKQE